MRWKLASVCAAIMLSVFAFWLVTDTDGQVRIEDWPPVATFSILGYDPQTGEVGGAVQSRVFSVGNGVLWGEANVGMVATQAIVDVSYGPRALELLRIRTVAGVWLNNDVVLRLQVDDHEQPIKELRRLVESAIKRFRLGGQ